MTLTELKKLVDSFDWEEWEGDLRLAFADDFEAVAIAQGTAEARALDLAFSEADPFLTRFFTSYIGERIKQLAATTRDIVIEELHAALEDGEGEGSTKLADTLLTAVDDSAALSPMRALMIARTETAIAYNIGAIAAFKQAGVTHVEVSDGDEDEDCAAADGEIWTLAEAMANPIAHPNCVRSFAPADDEDIPQDEAV